MKATILLILLAPATLLSAQEYRLPAIYSTVEQIRTGTIPLSRLTPNAQYSLLVSVPPAALGPDARLEVRLLDGETTLVSKTLHAGDADLYAPFHLGAAFALDQTRPRLQLTAEGVTGKLSLQINRWPGSPQLRRGANHTWQSASPMELGETVFASADEVEYIPVPGVVRKDSVADPRGEDWYRFRFEAARAKLVFFQLELTDRDDLPVDVSVFRVQDGKLSEYLRGQDPVAAPHEVQALPGNKFTPRVLEAAGDYYVRVRANHPEYRLRTRVYDAPPYDDPRQAVRTAVDYIMAAGDSWFANTPRRGGTLDRVAPVHQETSLCVACHASHFSQRAQLVSVANGYPVVQREQLQFLEDRFYQNPRPFYGFEQDGAVWSRVISAPANVLSRMSVLTSLFENNVSQQKRPEYHEKIAKYLRLYYADRHDLPPDETNGNTPLVSTFEIAWYSWKTLHDLGDDSTRLPEMIAAGAAKNMVDLCYQTLALADIDRAKYGEQIAANAARILSLQRADGQWSMRFDPKEPEVEFQTGHALWALSAAGIPVDHPQVKKAIEYLMGRQQDFGGWMDPLQSFENFKTPFRETQMAVLALSSYFPIQGRRAGWNAAPPASLSDDPVKFLNEASAIWEAPSVAVTAQLSAATRSNDAAIRQAAAEALGHLASPGSAPALTRLLGDPSKLVQRTAAWALRRTAQQNPGHAADLDRLLATALASPDDRVRWGATRVFAHHFGSLATDNTLVDALAKATADPVIAVRMQAVRGLWQSWFWNAGTAARGEIEDTLLGMFGAPQHPWVETNLRAAVYNLADENIRYLYNNWVALMGRDGDRQRAIQGRLAVEAQLADKLAAFLPSHTAPQQKRLLASLTEFPLRRADAYELTADFSTSAPLVYGRIGNDIEQIAFFGASADKLSRALLKLADSPDGEVSALARKALLIVRETPFKDVEAAAGGRSAGVMEASHWLDSHSETADIAKSFHMPPPRRPGSANASAKKPAAKLDEGYFHAYVDPIFHAKGPDGYACADCHSTHTLFNATFSTVMNVVDTANPENSLLLRKPTSTAETEGVEGSATLAHGGGRRFTTGSPEYETIRKWLEGAALP
jgi:hypothetical protein